MDAHLRLYLRLLHLIGIGEGEVASEVNELAWREQVTCGEGAVAVDGYLDVFDLNELIACLIYDGIDMTYWQFATLQTTHLRGTRFGDVELEVGRGSYVTNVGHVENLTQLYRFASHGTSEVLGETVNHEVEVQIAVWRGEYSAEEHTFPQHVERTYVAYCSEEVNLLHHELLDNELIDDFCLYGTTCRHLVDVEVDVELILVSEVCDVSCGVDGKQFVVGEDEDVGETHAVSIADKTCPEV